MKAGVELRHFSVWIDFRMGSDALGCPRGIAMVAEKRSAAYRQRLSVENLGQARQVGFWRRLDLEQ